MTDPYKVLGISSSATDEQVKDAYRKLARKYHPDNYVNNPLADLATEKMKEINEAYDLIQKDRKSGSNGTAYNSYSTGSNTQNNGYGGFGGFGSGFGGFGGFGGQQQYYSSSADTQYADVRRLINQSRIADAEELLDGVSSARRDAEWNYLKGLVNYKKGWMDNAMSYFRMACEIEPNNIEYRTTYSRLAQQQQNGFGGMQMGSSVCEICTTIWCLTACCGGPGGGC